MRAGKFPKIRDSLPLRNLRLIPAYQCPSISKSLVNLAGLVGRFGVQATRERGGFDLESVSDIVCL